LTSFKSISIKPYFWPKNTHNIKPDKLETTAKPDKLKTFNKLNKLGVLAEPDKIKVPLPTPEIPQKPTKPIEPIIKHSQKHP
jgi:hypothetical protein